MLQIKKYFHLLVAVLLAAMAGGLMWYYINLNTPTVRLVVAAEKLPMGKVLGTQSLRMKDFPKTMVPEGAQTAMEAVTGKTVISGTIFPGEIIRDVHIAEEIGSLKSVLASLAPDREAIDLPEDTAIGLTGIAIGDRVKVFTEVAVAKDITVVDPVAIDSVVLKVPLDYEGDKGAKAAYVIAVTPEESQRVAEGIVRGKKFSMTLLPKGVKR